MKFNEKLAALIGERDQSEIAKQAGLSAAALSTYLSGRAKPSADASVRLAKLLDCDLAWLLDDSRERDDRGPASLDGVTDEMLVAELRRRYIEAAVIYRKTIEMAADIDWKRMASLLKASPGTIIPPEVRDAAGVHFALVQNGGRWGTLASVLEFQPWALNKEVPAGIDPDKLKPESIRMADDSLYELKAGFKTFVELLGIKVFEASAIFTASEKKAAAAFRAKKR